MVGQARPEQNAPFNSQLGGLGLRSQLNKVHASNPAAGQFMRQDSPGHALDDPPGARDRIQTGSQSITPGPLGGQVHDPDTPGARHSVDTNPMEDGEHDEGTGPG